MKIEAITVVPVLNLPRLPVIAPLTLLKSVTKAVARSRAPSASIAQAAYRMPGSSTITTRPTSNASRPSTLISPDNR
ncbi:hypothetical protein ES703_55296 [subsurface metagenome]